MSEHAARNIHLCEHAALRTLLQQLSDAQPWPVPTEVHSFIQASVYVRPGRCCLVVCLMLPSSSIPIHVNPSTTHSAMYTHCTTHSAMYTHCTTHSAMYTHCTTHSAMYTHCTTHSAMYTHCTTHSAMYTHCTTHSAMYTHCTTHSAMYTHCTTQCNVHSLYNAHLAIDSLVPFSHFKSARSCAHTHSSLSLLLILTYSHTHILTQFMHTLRPLVFPSSRSEVPEYSVNL